MTRTRRRSRRRWLRSCGAIGAIGLTGCLDDGGTADGGDDAESGDGGDEVDDGESGEDADATDEGGDDDADDDNADDVELPPPSLGDGPVTVDVYEDFGCPHCHEFEASVFPELEASLIETGDVTYRHVDFPIPAHERSVAMANAARAVQDDTRTDDDPTGAFFAYKFRVFDAGEDDWTDEGLAALAADVGADPDAVATALEAETYHPQLVADRERGEALGVTGTPTVLVDGTAVEDPFDLEAIVEHVEEAT